MATLQELVNETTNIKDELKTCHSNLSSALTSKGVEVSSEDKMSSLIDKILSMRVLGNPIAGNNYTIYLNNTPQAVYSVDYKAVDEFTSLETGVIRYTFKMKPVNASSAGYALLQIYRNGEYEDIEKFQTNGNVEISHTKDINVSVGDVIYLSLKTNGKSYGCNFLSSTVKCNYEIL